jgi:hypothetical protein
MNKKEAALNLLNDIIYLEELQDKELQSLKRKSDPSHRTVGKSAISFHLEVVKELIQEL